MTTTLIFAAAERTIYAGTPLHFIPQPVADMWRVLLWAAELMLFASFLGHVGEVWRTRSTSYLSEWALWLYVAIGLMLLRSAIVQFERWNDPVLLEGLPVTTLIIMAAARARIVRAKRRPRP